MCLGTTSRCILRNYFGSCHQTSPWLSLRRFSRTRSVCIVISPKPTADVFPHESCSSRRTHSLCCGQLPFGSRSTPSKSNMCTHLCDGVSLPASNPGRNHLQTHRRIGRKNVNEVQNWGAFSNLQDTTGCSATPTKSSANQSVDPA